MFLKIFCIILLVNALGHTSGSFAQELNDPPNITPQEFNFDGPDQNCNGFNGAPTPVGMDADCEFTLIWRNGLAATANVVATPPFQVVSSSPLNFPLGVDGAGDPIDAEVQITIRFSPRDPVSGITPVTGTLTFTFTSPPSYADGGPRTNQTKELSATAAPGATQPVQHTLTVTTVGNGTVTSAPGGITCGAGGGDCTETYNEGTVVTLNGEVFGTNRNFVDWVSGGGECIPTSDTSCSVTMTAARAITATFPIEPPEITPEQFNFQFDGNNCNKTFQANIVPVGESMDCKFALEWSDGLEAKANVVATPPFSIVEPSPQIEFPLGRDKDGTPISTLVPITIRFSPQKPVSVDTTVEGSMTFTYTSPLGYTLGVRREQTIPLSAKAAPGPPRPVQRTLTVTKAGAGNGTVTGTGINCPGDCTHSPLDGTQVILTAKASSDSRFAGWSGGGCNGTTTTCAVTMTANRAVTATFDLISTDPIKNSHDLDGDGNADLVWRHTSNGTTAIWFMNGTKRASAGFTPGVPAAWQIVGIGDVNADGKADVIWRKSTSGTVAVWLMDRHTITSVGFPGTVPTGWVLEQTGDVDGNGTADLIWRNTNSGLVVVWLMNGGTIASSKSLGGVPGVWQIVGLGDVNADRKADVIWRNMSTGAVSVWLMNGLTVLSMGIPGSDILAVEVAGVGDVDGNGTADLIWRNTGSGAVAFWLMNGLTIGTRGALAGNALEWEIAQVSDLDRDEKVDIAWFNTKTGAVEVWLMNGVTVRTTGSPGPISPNWKIQ